MLHGKLKANQTFDSGEEGEIIDRCIKSVLVTIYAFS